MNELNQDLEYSLERNGDESINSKYYLAFRNLSEIRVETDIDRQKLGIDKELIFSNGHSVFVDEKKRRKDYGDILLEEYSDFDRKKVGWLGRHKYTDYITYIIEPANKIYFFPFLLLQRVWVSNYIEWINRYGRKFAQNNGYRTSNIAVPRDILLNELNEALVLSN